VLNEFEAPFALAHPPARRFPLRTRSKSTWQVRKPIPGSSSMASLGRCFIFQRDTQAVVPMLPQMRRMRNPVVLLASTASCNRRDAVKLRSFSSATTAVTALHFNASSVTHRASLSRGWIKSTCSDATPIAAARWALP
jgi:hypothetical protein